MCFLWYIALEFTEESRRFRVDNVKQDFTGPVTWNLG